MMAASTDGETPNLQNGEGDPPVRRSLGRRKCKGSETTKKKKKVPQRGMGVEKLERHRIQQELNKMKEIAAHPINISPNLHFLHAQMGFPKSDLHFGITNNFVGGFPKELSSTPNSVSCISQHCNSCHKKKKVINGGNSGSEVSECGSVGMNFRENQNIIFLSTEENDYALANSAGKKVMEYDFFPHKGDEELGMISCSSPKNCLYLDLSLKL